MKEAHSNYKTIYCETGDRLIVVKSKYGKKRIICSSLSGINCSAKDSQEAGCEGVVKLQECQKISVARRIIGRIVKF